MREISAVVTVFIDHWQFDFTVALKFNFFLKYFMAIKYMRLIEAF